MTIFVCLLRRLQPDGPASERRPASFASGDPLSGGYESAPTEPEGASAAASSAMPSTARRSPRRGVGAGRDRAAARAVGARPFAGRLSPNSLRGMTRLLVLVIAALAVAPSASGAIVVHNAKGFARAAAKLSHAGGTIVLRPGAYSSLELGPRTGGQLYVVGKGDVRVGRFLLWRTRRVSIGNLRIGPVGGDATLELQGASDVDLHNL